MPPAGSRESDGWQCTSGDIAAKADQQDEEPARCSATLAAAFGGGILTEVPSAQAVQPGSGGPVAGPGKPAFQKKGFSTPIVRPDIGGLLARPTLSADSMRGSSARALQQCGDCAPTCVPPPVSSSPRSSRSSCLAVGPWLVPPAGSGESDGWQCTSGDVAAKTDQQEEEPARCSVTPAAALGGRIVAEVPGAHAVQPGSGGHVVVPGALVVHGQGLSA
jgi:hypothetical protein